MAFRQKSFTHSHGANISIGQGSQMVGGNPYPTPIGTGNAGSRLAKMNSAMSVPDNVPASLLERAQGGAGADYLDQ